MTKIFISYRRDDAMGFAQAIYNDLTREFSQANVFMDVDAIEPGVDFVDAIQKAVRNCDILLALIGKRWASLQESGQAKIHAKDDFVRLEILTGLQNNIRIIPVLLEGASMPRESELPEELRPLTRRNAIDLSNTRFRFDVERLIKAIRQIRPNDIDSVPKQIAINNATKKVDETFDIEPQIRLVRKSETIAYVTSVVIYTIFAISVMGLLLMNSPKNQVFVPFLSAIWMLTNVIVLFRLPNFGFIQNAARSHLLLIVASSQVTWSFFMALVESSQTGGQSSIGTIVFLLGIVPGLVLVIFATVCRRAQNENRGSYILKS